MGPAIAVIAEESSADPIPAVEQPAAACAPSAHAHGFRPTLRHQAILVAYFALLFALLLPLVEAKGRWASFNATVAALLVSPWLLASLVLAFDRRGPLKHWLAPLLLASLGPTLALSYDLAVLAEWTSNGTLPRTAPLLFVNVGFVMAYAYYIRQVGPTACPSCSRRALIPVYYLWGSAPRTHRTRWCAACGTTYWRRNRAEPWQRERRSI